MTATDDKRGLLSKHYLFRDLAPETIDRIVGLGVVRRLDPGEQLFFKGDEGDALFGVLKGRIRICIVSPQGKEVTLNVIEPGEVFGEIALLDGKPRTADAVANAATDLLMIRRRDFRLLMEREPSLAIHLVGLLCERVRWTSAVIEETAFLDLPARLAKRLLFLTERHEEADKGPVKLALAQQEIGQMLGTTRESVNKHLQVWRREGWVELGRGTVTVMDREALQDLIDAHLGD